jgi:hypothetical protein
METIHNNALNDMTNVDCDPRKARLERTTISKAEPLATY